MTEKEIINYLKENRTKGVGFIFMPREVRIWITSNKSRLDYYNPSLNNWVDASHYGIQYSGIYSLPEDFKFEEKPQESGWVEFYIDKYGNAQIIDDDPTNPYLCYWYDWGGILSESSRLDWGLTAFGGWQYEDCNTWFMTPRLTVESPNLTTYQDSFCKDNYKTLECDDKPAIPTKIRFWREAE